MTYDPCQFHIPSLDPFIMQSNHKNIFRTKYDGVSSKLIAKQPYIWSLGGGHTQILTINDPKNWYYANNLLI